MFDTTRDHTTRYGTKYIWDHQYTTLWHTQTSKWPLMCNFNLGLPLTIILSSVVTLSLIEYMSSIDRIFYDKDSSLNISFLEAILWDDSFKALTNVFCMSKGCQRFQLYKITKYIYTNYQMFSAQKICSYM